MSIYNRGEVQCAEVISDTEDLCANGHIGYH